MGLLLDFVNVLTTTENRLAQFSVYGRLCLFSLLPSLLIVAWYAFQTSRTMRSRTPIVGKPSGFLLPTWRARLRYVFDGVSMIREGYQKVRQI